VTPHLATLGITRIADVTGLDNIGLPVMTAHRPNSCSLSVTQGKGVTAEAARASAIMEALEHHHAETIEAALRYATATDLERSGMLIDLARLPRIEGVELSRDKKALWLEGIGLRTGSALWIPFELIHMDYTLPLPPSLGCFLMNSTGLASGNTLNEALIHALSEVIERDAVTLWRIRPAAQSGCRIDPLSIDDALCRKVLGQLEDADVAFAIWDITSDVLVPAFFATIIDRDERSWRDLYPASGSGCHPCRSVALSRALTEAAQSRLTLIAGARDDRTREQYLARQNRDNAKRLRDEFAHGAMTRQFHDTPNHDFIDFDETLDWLLRRLDDAGTGEPAMVDLSKPGLPATVVRVVIPGLEGPSDAPGFCPGRRALVSSSNDGLSM